MKSRRLLLIGPSAYGQLPSSYGRSFERQGWDVFNFDYERAYFEAAWYAQNRYWRRALRSFLWNRLNRATIEVARCVKPDLVVAIKAAYLDPETIFRVRAELGVPFVNFYPDNPYCGVSWVPGHASAQRYDLLEAFRQYSALWIWERGLAERLRRDGVQAACLPFGVDPDLFYPKPGGSGEKCEECRGAHQIVFLGQCRSKRRAHVKAVRRHDVALWGEGWSHPFFIRTGAHRAHRNPSYGEACAKVYSSAAACLNILDDLNMPGHNMRTFEIPASGGVMLSSYTKEQDEFFPENEAAMYYRHPSELDEKIQQLVDDPRLRARLRANALEIAARHTYRARARKILDDLGLRSK